MNKRVLPKYAYLCVVAFALVTGLWLFIKYAIGALLPLLSALIISSFIRPLARVLGKRSRASAKICGAVLVGIVVFATVYGIICIGIKLVGEMTDFIGSAVAGLEREDNIIKRVIDYANELRERIPIFSKLEDSGGAGLSSEIYNVLLDSARRLAANISAWVTSLAAGFIRALPDFLFSVVVFVLSLFYLTMDYDGVKCGIKKLIPEAYYTKASRICGGVAGAVSGYIRAYFVLMLLTFSELLLGFVILRIKYSFFLAFIIAFIDILPVLGVGTVLVPWAVMLFMSGSSGKAVGLLILFGIMYVVRQFSEPRLIGRFMGLHPLLTLSAAYVGYSFFGIAGMIISPVILYIVKLVVAESSEVSGK